MKIVLLLFLLFPFISHAQRYPPDEGSNTRSVTISVSDDIQMSMESYYAYIKSKPTKGYRVQLMADDNRSMVYNEKTKFHLQYPDVPSFVLYQQPNFKLRVGNYRTRLEAFHMMKMLKPVYPTAIVVQEEIAVKEFITQP